MPGRKLIKAWLKAGYVEAEVFHETEDGKPQGGVILPCLLKEALSGLQRKIGPAYGYVCYAEHLIVCPSTCEQFLKLMTSFPTTGSLCDKISRVKTLKRLPSALYS